MIIQIISIGIVIEIYVLVFMSFMHYLSNRDIRRENEINKLIQKEVLK